MASTKIPAVEAALLATLAEAEGLSDVTITGDREPERPSEYIWLWKAGAERDFATLGHRPPTLTEKISVVFRVVAIGRESKSRAYELFDAAETALRSDFKLGGEVMKNLIKNVEPEPVMFDTKPGFHILMTVVAETRI